MKYKLVCIDIDGTLINSKGKISNDNLTAIREAQAQGAVVTLVTGRRYLAAKPFAQELGLNLPLICFNGGLIVDTHNNKAFHTAGIDLQYATTIIDAWHQLTAPIFVYRHSTTPPDVYHQNLCTHRQVRDYLEYEGANVATVDNIKKHLDWSPLRVMTFGQSELVQRCHDEYQDLYQRQDIRILMTSSYDYDNASFLEIYPASATKSNGLRWLSKYCGIPREQILAIGDHINDVDMIEWAGMGVAMGNAHQDVLSVADYITADRNNSGVARAIEEFVLA